jgi:hypothetical protein
MIPSLFDDSPRTPRCPKLVSETLGTPSVERTSVVRGLSDQILIIVSLKLIFRARRSVVCETVTER